MVCSRIFEFKQDMSVLMKNRLTLLSVFTLYLDHEVLNTHLLSLI